MRRVERKLISVLLALAMVVLCLPEYVKPVNKAVAAEATTRVIYERTDVLAESDVAGMGEYLIVGSMAAGESKALSHYGTSVTTDEVTIHAASEDENANDFFIEADDVDAASIWKAESANDLMRLHNDNYYLQITGTSGARQLAITEGVLENNTYKDFCWQYMESNNRRLYVTYYNGSHPNTESKGYITYNGSTFSGTSLAATVYIYAKKVICLNHKYELQEVEWNHEWLFGDEHTTAKAILKCNSCGETVHADMDVNRDDIPGDCVTAPSWKYTATVKAPDGSTITAEPKTVPQKVVDETKPKLSGKFYVLSTTAPSNGEKYLIVSSNQACDAHALANGYPETNSSNLYVVKDREVTIVNGKIDDAADAEEVYYIKAAPADAVWSCSVNGQNYHFANAVGSTSYILFHMGGAGSHYAYVATSGQADYRRWQTGATYLRYRSNGGNYYYLNYNSGWVLTNNNTASIPVYYYIEKEISMFDYKEAEPSGHPTDKFKHFDAKAETCTENGNIEYWYCEACKNYYNNEDGAESHKINAESVVIDACHEWVFGGFTWEGNEVAGYTGVTASFTCNKTTGETHTPDPAVTVDLSTQELDPTADEPAKIVYTASISSESSPDGKAHTDTMEIERFKITFVDENNNVIDGYDTYYNKGTLPGGILTPAVSKASDQQYTYSFDGWNPEIQKVTADATYQAKFKTVLNAYEITFLNNDGALLKTVNFEYGEMPTYEGTPTLPPTVDKVFEFTGWDPELTEVTGEQEYTAQYTEKPREYMVSFTVEGYTTQGQVKYGDRPTYNGTPVKPSTDDRFRYEFVGWNNGTETFAPGDDLPEVKGNQSYTAVFVTKYHVIIETINGGEVKIVDSGDTYFAAGEVISLTETTEDGYVYVPGSIKVAKGEESVAVTENENGTTFTMPEGAVTVTAKFIRAYEIYIGDVQVTEENLDDVFGDGSVSCAYDDTENKEMWTITFTKAPALTNDDYPAIIWFLEPAPLTVVAPKDGLALESNSAIVGIFCPEYGLIIEGDLTITLNGKPSPYSDFPGLHGIGAASLEVNGNLTIVIDPDETGEDAGADPEDFGGIYAEDGIAFGSKMSTVDITVPEGGIAIYTESEGDITIPETHGIKLPEDGKVDAFVYDSSIGDVAPKIVTIVDADGAIANIVAIRKICKVEFKNGEEVLAEDDYFVGDTPEIILEKEPEKEKDKQYTYEFAGWEDQDGNKYPKTGDLPELTGDTTFTAYFEGTLNKYTVTFVDEDGKTELSKETYEYGTKAADIKKPANPTKEPEGGKTYGFGGWTPEIADVTGDATYTATYVDADAKYTVTFVDEDGKELKAATEYTYGTKAADIVKPADPKKAEDDKYTYEFSGWTPEITDVINNVTYKATYKATEKPEKGVYQYVGPAELTYTKGSGKGFVFTFKRTKNDELTKERFRKFLRNGADIDSKWLKITYGSVIIEVSSEYLDSLPEGRNEFVATFEDGDPVSVALTILPAQSSEEETSPDSPKTADTMFVLWLALILGIATVAVAVMIKKREKEEEIGL